MADELIVDVVSVEAEEVTEGIVQLEEEIIESDLLEEVESADEEAEDADEEAEDADEEAEDADEEAEDADEEAEDVDEEAEA